MLSPPEGLTDDDFERIESAVMETERGRWFLQEFARRLRAAETSEILAAVERLAARDASRDRGEQIARRNASEAAIALVEALQKLSALAAGPPRGESAGKDVAPEMSPKPRPPSEPVSELDRRLAALKELDALDVEAKVKLFG